MDDRLPPLRRHLPIFCFAAVAALLVLAQVAHQPLDVDENVFVASASLLARHSLLIYRDFHYNHMPTQVLLFAAAFRASDHLLLVARLIGGACAVALAVTVFACARRSLGDAPPRRRLWMAAGVGALLLFDPLFVDEVGKAWNHDLAALACLLGFLAAGRAVRAGGHGAWAAVGGGCLATAVTTRLTFAPTALAFVLLIALAPGPTSRAARWRTLAWFALGAAIASLPSLWVILQSPSAAYFGNFRYPRLNTRFHVANATDDPISLPARLWYVVRSLVTMPGHGVVTIGFLWLTVATLRPRAVRRTFVQAQLACLAVLVGVLYAGSFAAAPMQRQYLYAPTPFMVLAIALCLGRSRALDHRHFARWFGGLVALTVVAGANEYNGLAWLPTPSRWVPMQVHASGVALARQVGAEPGHTARVLTLYPVFPLEGNLDIYPELATGRFGLRVAGFLSAEERAAYKMPNPDAVGEWLATRPPDAVLLVGTSRELELQMGRQAVDAGYVLTSGDAKRRTYERPQRDGSAARAE